MLETYFKTENYEKADKLIKKYNREHSIEFSFGAVVIAFLKDNILLADKLLQKAINTNKYFVSEA